MQILGQDKEVAAVIPTERLPNTNQNKISQNQLSRFLFPWNFTVAYIKTFLDKPIFGLSLLSP
jgi:hypothetical protein